MDTGDDFTADEIKTALVAYLSPAAYERRTFSDAARFDDYTEARRTCVSLCLEKNADDMLAEAYRIAEELMYHAQPAVSALAVELRKRNRLTYDEARRIVEPLLNAANDGTQPSLRC